MSLLNVQREGTGSTLVWLHGFTQTHASAHQFRSILAGTRDLWTLDLPGHGSQRELRCSLNEIADLIAQIFPDTPIDLGGYSLGGRVALHVALRHPTRLRRLVILGATRGIADEGGRAARRAHDELLAQRIERIGTDAFLEEWLAQPMFATLPPDPRERSARSTDPYGLASSLRCAGTGTQAWLAPALAALPTPVLALAGELDLKFTAEARAIANDLPRGRAETIALAGHAAHLENPVATARSVERFLAS